MCSFLVIYLLLLFKLPMYYINIWFKNTDDTEIKLQVSPYLLFINSIPSPRCNHGYQSGMFYSMHLQECTGISLHVCINMHKHVILWKIFKNMTISCFNFFPFLSHWIHTCLPRVPTITSLN